MSNPFRILISIDLETGTDRLVAEAARYGRALGAVIDIVHVILPDPAFVGNLKIDPRNAPTQEDLIRDEKASTFRSEHGQTQEIGAHLRDSGIDVRHALTVQGPILQTILEHAERLGSDLLILGSHQHGTLYRLWYGDTATDAIKNAPCALLVVPI